jgi:mannose-1-phosphate guanylyltransferase
MFIWKASQIMQEFSQQMPELAFGLEKIAQNWNTSNRDAVLETIWDGLKVQTIDFGIMEGAQHVAVIPATGLNWSDVGSWDSLFEVIKADDNGNIILAGEHVGLETQNSLIYTDQGHPLVVTIGIENLVVVYVGDVLLVCNKDQAQKVRTVVNQLRQSGHESI